MSRRHRFIPTDPSSAGARLCEVLATDGRLDLFEEGLKLVAAALVAPERLPAAGLWAAQRRWPGLFEGELQSRPTMRQRVFELLQALNLRDPAVLDALLEQLVSRVARADKGQFFTPRWVVDAMVSVVPLRPDDVVLDPACGPGGFLRAALAREPRIRALGWDVDPRARRLAQLSLELTGHPFDVDGRDGLTGATPPRVDVILTNPPFAGDVDDETREAFPQARALRGERDVLFLERCVEILRPGGVLAIILASNKLESQRYTPLRQWLLRELRVVGVASLARETFLPHTSQRVGVLFAVKRPRPVAEPARSEVVHFFRSVHAGKDGGGAVLRDPAGRVAHDLDELVAPFRAQVEAAWAS